MAKPVINYKGYMTVNPGDRSGDKICIPQIVDRNQVKTLESIVEEAIDRGLIAGLKASAAAGVAQGIMIQLGQTLNGGTGIIFGDYFAVRPYLTGTIENLLSPISAENKLRVRFVPGSAYKLDERNFSFHNVTESEDLPKIVEVVPDENGAAPGTYKVGEGLVVTGEKLKLEVDRGSLNVYDLTGETPSLVTGIAADVLTTNNDACLIVDPALVQEDWPAKIGLKEVKQITIEGIEQTIESNMFEAVRAAGGHLGAGDAATRRSPAAHDEKWKGGKVEKYHSTIPPFHYQTCLATKNTKSTKNLGEPPRPPSSPFPLCVLCVLCG